MNLFRVSLLSSKLLFGIPFFSILFPFLSFALDLLAKWIMFCVEGATFSYIHSLCVYVNHAKPACERLNY